MSGPATYSITDPSPVVTGSTAAFVSDNLFLEDLTTGTYLYDTSSGGSLTGSLMTGDEYEFSGSASFTALADPTLSYSPGITFAPMSSSATPEPSSLLLLGSGLVGMVGAARRRLA